MPAIDYTKQRAREGINLRGLYLIFRSGKVAFYWPSQPEIIVRINGIVFLFFFFSRLHSQACWIVAHESPCLVKKKSFLRSPILLALGFATENFRGLKALCACKQRGYTIVWNVRNHGLISPGEICRQENKRTPHRGILSWFICVVRPGKAIRLLWY